MDKFRTISFVAGGLFFIVGLILIWNSVSVGRNLLDAQIKDLMPLNYEQTNMYLSAYIENVRRIGVVLSGIGGVCVILSLGKILQ